MASENEMQHRGNSVGVDQSRQIKEISAMTGSDLERLAKWTLGDRWEEND